MDSNQQIHQKTEQPPSDKYKEKIDSVIKEEFEERAKYFGVTNLNLYTIYTGTIIPKRREQLQLILEVEDKEIESNKLENEIIIAATNYKEKEAKLRNFEKNNESQSIIIFGIKILNYRISSAWIINTLEWLLKAGLTFITIISLFGIVGITNLKNPLSIKDIGITLGFIVFASVSLAWLTSAAIFNKVISSEDKKTYYAWAGMILISEMALGLTTVPGLINLIRLEAAKRGGQGATPIKLINNFGLEWFGIAIGVTIFALINILFAISKAQAYKSNLPNKIEYAKTFELYKNLTKKQEKLINEIKSKKERIQELEKVIYLEYEHEYIKNLISALSNEVSTGERHQGKYPITGNSSLIKADGSPIVNGSNSTRGIEDGRKQTDQIN